jgi:hypothetical protein
LGYLGAVMHTAIEYLSKYLGGELEYVTVPLHGLQS